MNEWQLIQELSKASNNELQDKVSELILNNDFSDKGFAQEVAILSFSILRENIKLYNSTAIKILSFKSNKLGLAACIRQEIIRELVNEFSK